MTLSTLETFKEFPGTGAQTVFPFNIKFLADEDLKVNLIDDTTQVPTPQVLTTDYSVSGAGEDAGGTVTMVVAPPAGTTLRIDRFVTPDQEVDFTPNDPFPAEVNEDALDRLTMMIQQLLDRTGGLSFLLNATLTLQLSTNAQNEWDALNKRIINVADPTDDQDAATKKFVTSQIIASGNVPAPLITQVGEVLTATAVDTFDWAPAPGSLVPTPADPADDGKHISASGGVYIIRTAAESRTDLGLGTAAVLNAGLGVGDLVQLIAGPALPAVSGANLTNLPGATLGQDSLVIIVDEKAAGTDGGSFTQGAFQTRTLNTEKSDTGSLATLAANQITLVAGTYLAEIRCPAFRCRLHKARLRNVTDGTDLVVGSPEDLRNGSRDSGESYIVGVFTVPASKALEVQHQCSDTRNTDGFGVAAGFGLVEIYTTVKFTKLG